MDVIEKAIRGAFEKGDSEDKVFRERVYRSAFAALDRALQANPGVTVETAIGRRKALQAKITEIESEYIPSVTPLPQAPLPSARAPAPEPAEPARTPPALEPEAVRQAPEPPASQPAASPPVPQSGAPDRPFGTADEPSDGPATAAWAAPDVSPSPPLEPPIESVAPPAAAIPVAPVVVADQMTPDGAGAAPEIDLGSPADARRQADAIEIAPASQPTDRDNATVAGPEAEAVALEPVRDDGRQDPSFGPAPDIEIAETPASAGQATPEVVVFEEPAAAVPASSAPHQADVIAVDPDAAVVRERRRPYAAMFLAVTLFTAGAIGLWWANETGLLKSAAERDTRVPNPSPQLESEDFIPEDQEPVQAPAKPAEADALKDWIAVFNPSDASSVNAPSSTTAEVVKGEDGEVLRIRSGTSGAAILFDVGQGVLEKIAGKHAMFDIVARAEEGHETQISVTCNFGELGDCGRKRYAVGHERGEFLFEMQLPAGKPGAGGTIAINPDISNEGKAIDLFEIRVSAGE